MGDNGEVKVQEERDPFAVLQGGFHHGIEVPSSTAFYKLPVMLLVDGQEAGLIHPEIYKPRQVTDGAKCWMIPWLTERHEVLIVVEQMIHGVIDSIRLKFVTPGQRFIGKKKWDTRMGIMKSAEVVVGMRTKALAMGVAYELLESMVIDCAVLNMDGTADCKLNKSLKVKKADKIVDKDHLPKEKDVEHDGDETAEVESP